MFARSHRFSFKRGVPRNTFQTPFFVIRYDKGSEEKLECAVVVGKRVDKKATSRNRIKRQTVAIIKDILSSEAPFRLVIYAKRSILGTQSEEIRNDLKKSFETIGITKWT